MLVPDSFAYRNYLTYLQEITHNNSIKSQNENYHKILLMSSQMSETRQDLGALVQNYLIDEMLSEFPIFGFNGDYLGALNFIIRQKIY